MKVMAMLFYNNPPMTTLHGRHQDLELYPDRVILRSTRWRARRFPLFFGTAKMLYLDEVTSVSLCPLHFQPVFRFRLIIHSQNLHDAAIECLEADFAIANWIIDYIEDYTSQGAFQPPAGS